MKLCDMVRWLALVGALAAGPAEAAAALHVCAGGHAGFSIGPDPLATGAVTVPKGAVFRFAGVRLALSETGEHDGHGIASDRYAARRGERRQRFESGLRDDPALVTRRAATLQRSRRCADLPVAALVSPRFGWSTAPVKGDGTVRFKPYGTVRDGHLDLDYAGAGEGFRRAAIRGAITATFRGETDRTVHLATRNLHVVPRHRRRHR